MKRVVVYGIYGIELRRKIEHFMDDNYEIIGYMDSFLKTDILDGKKYYDISDINSANIDYIVLAIQNRYAINNVSCKLIEAGIAKEKIIIPEPLINSNYMWQKDLVQTADGVDEDTKIIIFGLSYSLRGIIKERLCKNAYDFSWHGLDLYYNYQLYQKAKSKMNPEIAMFVFTYDYFNFDMSLSKWQYTTGQIMSISNLDDFHNGINISEFSSYIVAIKMFAKKYMQYYNCKENIYVNSTIDDNTTYELGHTWLSQHSDTLNENIELFKEFVLELRKTIERVIVVVPPYLLSNVSNVEVMSEEKGIFYGVMKELGIEVVDCLDSIKDKELYADVTHLNYKGAQMFTKMLNDIIIGEFSPK